MFKKNLKKVEKIGSKNNININFNVMKGGLI